MKSVVRGGANLLFVVGAIAMIAFAVRGWTMYQAGNQPMLDPMPMVISALLGGVVLLLAAVAGMLCSIDDKIEQVAKRGAERSL